MNLKLWRNIVCSGRSVAARPGFVRYFHVMPVGAAVLQPTVLICIRVTVVLILSFDYSSVPVTALRKQKSAPFGALFRFLLVEVDPFFIGYERLIWVVVALYPVPVMRLPVRRRQPYHGAQCLNIRLELEVCRLQCFQGG